MVGIAGADEAIARNLQFLGHCLEIAAHFIGQRTRGQVTLARFLDHFQAMFIGPGLEADFAAQLALIARDRIGRDRLIGMPDMRTSIGIADCGGDIIRVGHGRLLEHRSPQLKPWRRFQRASRATIPAIS
ncbi:hypothetical protein D9M73_123870 [compost metagenome]